MAMYIDIVPNRKSPPAILLRESVRRGQKIVKRTIANLSNLSIVQAQAIRQILKGEKLVRPEKHFDILSSSAHGSVQAVLVTIRKLGLDKLIASRRCQQRDLVIAMIASRILEPQSKLALSRSWENTTLGKLLRVEGADEDALYAAVKASIYRPGGLLCLSNHMSGPEVTQPMQFGSHRSRLVLTLLHDDVHLKDVSLSSDQWETLVTWVDANAPYRSTYYQYFNSDGKLLSNPKRIQIKLDPPFPEQ